MATVNKIKGSVSQSVNNVLLALVPAFLFKIMQIVCAILFPIDLGLGQFPALLSSGMFTALLILFFFSKFERLSSIHSGKLFSKNNVKYTLIGAGFVITGILLSSSEGSSQSILTDLQVLWAENVWGKILIFTSLVIYIPLVEELLFRGILFRTISKVCDNSWPLAALLSSFIFAFFHFDVSSFLALFSLGMLSSWVFFQTKSVYCSFAVHALNNMIVLYITLLSK